MQELIPFQEWQQLRVGGEGLATGALAGAAVGSYQGMRASAGNCSVSFQILVAGLPGIFRFRSWDRSSCLL